MRHDLQLPLPRQAWIKSSLTAVLFALGAGSALAGPPLEAGIWINHTGQGAVEIRPCGDTGAAARRLCGYIVWLKQPNNAKGQPLTDGYNPDPAKRSRTICGLPVLGSLEKVSRGWDNGWVYDPEKGAQFDAAIVAGRQNLILTGYKGVKFFSKSFTWRRAPADLQRCDQPVRASIKQTGVKIAQPQVPLKVPRPVPAIRPSIE